MKKRLPLIVLSAAFLAACSKPAPNTPAAPPAQPAEPRATLAESMGITPDPDAYARPNPPPAAAETPAADSPIKRTLTAKDGRSLEAFLLSRTDNSVKVRRVADSTEFVITFDKLSDADQAFIRESAIPVTP